MSKKAIQTILVFTMSLTLILNAAATDHTVSSIDTLDGGNATYQQLIDDFLEAQYSALVTSNYSDIDTLLAENEATQYYLDCLKYRVDASFAVDDYWLDYSYNWKSFESETIDGITSFIGKYNLNFTYASGFNGMQPDVLVKGTIEASPDGLVITAIDSNEIFYADLKDNLNSRGLITTKKQVSSPFIWNAIDINALPEAIVSIDSDRVSSYLNDMLNYFTAEKYVEHEESTDVISADPVLGRAAYSYNANAGISYGNQWFNTYNPNFVIDGSADCTRFVSQCIWSAYGQKMESSSSMSNWFGHKNGSGNPWESVTALWNYSTTRTGTQTGPRASGYNNNAHYTGIAAYAMAPGNVVQFKTSGGFDYGHSVYVISNNATAHDNYGSVGIVQHSDFGKITIYSKILAYGSNFNMRRLSFTTAQF